MAGTENTHAPAKHLDLDHGLAIATLATAVVGAITLVLGQHTLAAVLGALGLVCGLVAQMVSRTRGERWLDMVGMLAAFVVLAIAAAQGGFS